MTDFEVTNDEAAGRYETVVDGYTAELNYRLTGDRMVITHTGVPPAIEGRGIGSALVRAAVEDATARDLTIVPLCPFVGAWLDRHPENKVKVARPDS
jgi:predicted GNAT family acetyltransferase